MIKTQIIGHLGKDAVVNMINGKNVINFSVAHSEKFKDAQGVVITNTTWVDCSYWTDRTAIAPYLKKGTQVYVEGKPSPDTFKDQQGNARAILRLRVDKIELLGSPNRNDQPQQLHASNSNPSDITTPEDDLPF